MFNIHRGYRRSSSSDEDTGAGPGSRPPPAQPAPGGGPQRSAGSRPHRVRRALFGRSDPEENIRFVRQELARHRESQSNRWNFDFEHEQPLKGRLDWEVVDKQQIHPVYKLSRLPYLRSHDESERENLPENSSNKTGLKGSVDDLKTPPSSTEPPDTVPCSTNLPPGGLPGLPSTSGLPPGGSGGGKPPGIPSSRSVPSSLRNYGVDSYGAGSGASSSSLSSSTRDPGGTGFAGLSGHPTTSHSGAGQSSTSRPPDYPSHHHQDQGASRASRIGSSHYQPASTRSGGSHSHSSQTKSGEPYNTTSFRPYSSSTTGVSEKKPAPFRVPNPSIRVTTKIQPYVDPTHDVNSQAYGARGSDNKQQEGVIVAPAGSSSDPNVVGDHNDGDNTGGGARPKTKEQKITDKFRSRKMSRSKSASKLKRLGGGAGPSRSPSVKARHQSRSTLPGPR